MCLKPLWAASQHCGLDPARCICLSCCLVSFLGRKDWEKGSCHANLHRLKPMIHTWIQTMMKAGRCLSAIRILPTNIDWRWLAASTGFEWFQVSNWDLKNLVQMHSFSPPFWDCWKDRVPESNKRRIACLLKAVLPTCNVVSVVVISKRFSHLF